LAVIYRNILVKFEFCCLDPAVNKRIYPNQQKHDRYKYWAQHSNHPCHACQDEKQPENVNDSSGATQQCIVELYVKQCLLFHIQYFSILKLFKIHMHNMDPYVKLKAIRKFFPCYLQISVKNAADNLQ
jgi:hypothetical protein